MPKDGISRLYCYSLTDLHNFDACPFLFYVNHHLDKKYELESGNRNMALGTLLDEAMKKYHLCNGYGLDKSEVINIVRGAANYIKVKEEESYKKPSFYTGVIPFLDNELIGQANQIFVNFLDKKKISKSIGPVEFCSRVLKGQDCLGIHNDETKCCFKVWGLPDAYEMGEDGVLEVVDYKSRVNVERGKENMDMDLMPKMYALLCCDYLLKQGFKKIRFVVRFWQDPEETTFCEEFDLEMVCEFESIFREKIQNVLDNKILNFCEMPYCKACKSEKREEYIEDLSRFGLTVNTLEKSPLDEFIVDNNLDIPIEA